MLQFACNVIIFLHIDIQPIRAAFEIPHLDILVFQVVQRGYQAVNHLFAFGNVFLGGFVVGAVKLAARKVSFGAPFHSMHGVESVVKDFGVPFGVFLRVAEAVFNVENVIILVVFRWKPTCQKILVISLDAVAHLGRIERHHFFGHRREFPNLISTCRVCNCLKLLDEVGRFVTKKVRGDVFIDSTVGLFIKCRGEILVFDWIPTHFSSIGQTI